MIALAEEEVITRDEFNSLKKFDVVSCEWDYDITLYGVVDDVRTIGRGKQVRIVFEMRKGCDTCPSDIWRDVDECENFLLHDGPIPRPIAYCTTCKDEIYDKRDLRSHPNYGDVICDGCADELVSEMEDRMSRPPRGF